MAGLPAAAHASSYVANPSFELNYNSTFPGYGPITGWTGGSGVNQATGPFHNAGTPIPDGARVAFQQGSGSLSQTIAGLTVGKRYWLQFFHDARGCCGGTIDLSTRWNGTEIDRIAGLSASTAGAPYKPRHISFEATGTSGTLTFVTTAAGDATALLDGVVLAQRDPGNAIVFNPGFEASGDAAGSPMAGWTSVGTVGVNRSPTGPLADNGTAPEQDHVAFLRNSGSLIRQTIDGLIPGEPYTVSVAANARTGNTPRLRISAGGTIISETDISPVGATNPYVLRSASFVAAGTSAVLEFAQVGAGDQTVLIDDVKLTGLIQEPLPCLGLGPTRLELSPGQQSPISVTVPAALVAHPPPGGVQITLRSPNPLVLRIPSGIDDVITLSWLPGEPLTKSFLVEAVAPGTTSLDVLSSATLCVDRTVTGTVTTQIVRNPSFEIDGIRDAVGYSAITAWESDIPLSGLNRAGLPFLDNGVAPDREQVGFLQGNGILRQTLGGLFPGQNYWVQFRYNARTGGSTGFAVRFGGSTIATVPAVTPVGGSAPFHAITIPFVPTASGGLLEIATTVVGDATLLLDAVTVVPRASNEIVLQNPSFDAAGRAPDVGYLGTARLAGWTYGGGAGLNRDGVGPFTDNGDAPDQEMVLFLQNTGFVAQNVAGLTPGGTYTLAYAVNARACCTSGSTPYQVSFAGVTLFSGDVSPVGLHPYERRHHVFTAPAASGELRFSSTNTAGDHTLLLDDIHLIPGDADPGHILVPLTMENFAGNALRLYWPATAAPGTRLQWSLTLQPGSWVDSTVPPVIEGPDFTVYDPIDDRRRFYRLLRP